MRKSKKKDLLDTADLVALFHKSARTIARWRKAGILEGNKIGKTYYYHLEDIRILIEKLRKKGK